MERIPPDKHNSQAHPMSGSAVRCKGGLDFAPPGASVLPMMDAETHPICALCGRVIPPDVPQSLHHLIPKLKGGKGGPVVLLHHICHKEIHATLTEAELARDYATPEALRAHPRLAKFAAWVAKRPPGFLSKSKGGRRKR